MIDPIEELAKCDISKLKDRDFIIDLIRVVGLHYDPKLTDLYGKQNIPYQTMNGMLQIPEQLADALIYLSDKEIHQYVEIGTFNGLSTVFITAYLTRFNPDLKTLTIDIDQRFSNSYKHLRIVAVKGTSNDYKGFESDLCFIDGDHSLEWVTKDFNNIGCYAKICMFHDILETTGIGVNKMEVPQFWEKLDNRHKIEFISGGRMGIGVLNPSPTEKNTDRGEVK